MTRATGATPGPDPVSAPDRVSALRPVGARLFTPPSTSATWRGDGSVILRSRTPLGAYADSMAQLFRAAAGANPDRVLVAERDGHSWRTMTYGAARRQIDGLAQALLDEAGAGALEAVSGGRAVITRSGRAGPGYLGRLDELAATAPTGRVEERFAAVCPDTVAKILFTFGSTGHPKGVINTHRFAADLKLATGTWVWVGTLRVALLSAADGLLQDVVLTGITDNGYLNQRAVLERRAQFVAAVHAQSPGPEIIQPVPPSGQLSGGRP